MSFSLQIPSRGHAYLGKVNTTPEDSTPLWAATTLVVTRELHPKSSITHGAKPTSPEGLARDIDSEVAYASAVMTHSRHAPTSEELATPKNVAVYVRRIWRGMSNYDDCATLKIKANLVGSAGDNLAPKYTISAKRGICLLSVGDGETKLSTTSSGRALWQTSVTLGNGWAWYADTPTTANLAHFFGLDLTKERVHNAAPQYRSFLFTIPNSMVGMPQIKMALPLATSHNTVLVDVPETMRYMHGRHAPFTGRFTPAVRDWHVGIPQWRIDAAHSTHRRGFSRSMSKVKKLVENLWGFGATPDKLAAQPLPECLAAQRMRELSTRFTPSQARATLFEEILNWRNANGGFDGLEQQLINGFGNLNTAALFIAGRVDSWGSLLRYAGLDKPKYEQFHNVPSPEVVGRVVSEWWAGLSTTTLGHSTSPTTLTELAEVAAEQWRILVKDMTTTNDRYEETGAYPSWRKIGETLVTLAFSSLAMVGEHARLVKVMSECTRTLVAARHKQAVAHENVWRYIYTQGRNIAQRKARKELTEQHDLGRFAIPEDMAAYTEKLVGAVQYAYSTPTNFRNWNALAYYAEGTSREEVQLLCELEALVYAPLMYIPATMRLAHNDDLHGEVTIRVEGDFDAN